MCKNTTYSRCLALRNLALKTVIQYALKCLIDENRWLSSLYHIIVSLSVSFFLRGLLTGYVNSEGNDKLIFTKFVY